MQPFSRNFSMVASVSESILFPEACAISRVCADTHANKFMRTICRTCKIKVFSLLLCYYYKFVVRRNFSLTNFSLNIIYMKFKTQLIIKYFRKNFPQVKHYLSLLDTGILLCSHFHEQCICSKPTWIFCLMHQLLTLHSTTYSRTSLPAAFIVGPLVLPREKHPCNTMQVWRCMLKNAQRAKSAMNALTDETAFLRFYQKMSHMHDYIHEI